MSEKKRAFQVELKSIWNFNNGQLARVEINEVDPTTHETITPVGTMELQIGDKMTFTIQVN